MIPFAANVAWLLSSLPSALAFRRASGNVEAAQRTVLRSILTANASSDFGLRHDFASIRSIADFQQRVSVGTYEDLRLDMERAARGEHNVLAMGKITHFVPTSGTTLAPKLIPFSRALQNDFERAIAPWIVDLFAANPALLPGTAYWSLSPALQNQEQTAGGIPIGFAADDEYFGAARRWLVRSSQSVPAEVAGIRDLDAFRYATLYFLVADRRLAQISVWNPTFLSLLVAPLRTMGASLVHDLAAGTISRSLELDSAKANRLSQAAFARRSARRAAEVEVALQCGDDASMHLALWPGLRVISCWMDAHAAQPARELSELFPHATLQAKGLLSTEGFVSFPLSRAGGSVLAVRSHFFEFAQPDSNEIVLAHQLQRGSRYRVILTTSGGLYRYATGDLVEVTAMFRSCPVLRFAGRDLHVDYFGEKLSETLVREALDACVPRFRFALLARDGEEHAYTLFVESSLDDTALITATRTLDAALQVNIHYKYCRDLGQLEPLRLFRIAGDGAACYLVARAAMGQRAGDVKPLALDGSTGWSNKFTGRWIVEE